MIERWVRIRIVRLGAVLGRRIARPKIWFRERPRTKALEAAFEAVKEQAIKLEKSDFEASMVFMNVALFFLLAERDINAVKLNALTHPDYWTRGVALRTILLTIHELDLDKVAGKKLQQAMDDTAVPDKIRREVTVSLRKVRTTQLRAKKMMGHVRNTAIAHRDADALIQYRAIRDLDTQSVFELAADYYDSAGRFIAVLPRLIDAGGSLTALVRQYLKTTKN